MSRSSPGRYAAFDFVASVFDEHFTDAMGKPLIAIKPNPQSWHIAGHKGTVQVTYKVFGDRVDGTYAAVESTHAHLNLPAVLMWARGIETPGTTEIHGTFRTPLEDRDTTLSHR